MLQLTTPLQIAGEEEKRPACGACGARGARGVNPRRDHGKQTSDRRNIALTLPLFFFTPIAVAVTVMETVAPSTLTGGILLGTRSCHSPLRKLARRE